MPSFRPGDQHGFTWDECDGDILVRYRKTYGPADEERRRAPHLALIPTCAIQSPIFVIEDFPYLFDDFSSFVDERLKVVNDFGGKVVERHRLRHDYVYAVKPMNLWPSKFAGKGPRDPWADI